MSDDTKVRRVRQGHQPAKNEITKGYRPTQPVDLSNIKIPTNLSDAAVVPQDNSRPAPSGTRPSKT